jgi:TRAP-type uncharacterized transport system fused permease subunit
VEFQARKMNLASSQVEVDYRALFLTAPLFLGSLGIIIALFMIGRSPMYVGFWACLGIIIMSLIRKKTRPSFSSLVKGLVSGALTGASVAATVGTLGIIVAVLTNTGLGVKLAAVIGTVAGDNLLLLLILTGIGALVLGIGLPASAAYLVVAIVLAPILVKGGVPLLAAHLFAFYLANFSYITPPVAVAAVFASRVAGSDFIKTAFQASKVGIGAYVMPFMVVWVGALTWRFSDPFFTVTGIISCIITFIGIQASLAGYFLTDLNLIERFTFIAGSFFLLVHIATTNIGWFIAGIAILVVMVFWQRHKNERLKYYLMGESQNH